MTKFDQAQQKVLGSESLAIHEDFILADWPEGDEHLDWVIESDESDILDWAQQ